MANQEHVERLRQGVESWNAWRKENPEVQPDLLGAILSGADLSRADLSRAILSGADLSFANLSFSRMDEAKLHRAKLNEANLFGAFLTRADLAFADLYNANLVCFLEEADLTEANLAGANLCEADLMYATLIGTNFLQANLRKAKLTGANLVGANLTSADLREAYLDRAILVRANLRKAILTKCHVYGLSVWDIDLTEADQSNLVITDPTSNDPLITVGDLEVAQFVYLLLNHKKLRNVLNAVTERGVLLLGRFGGGGLEVLQAVAAKLREAQYLPIIFDFDRPSDRNYTETVKTLAGLSRFIIADLSGPSVPQELYATVPHFKIPFVPILEAGRKQFAMAVDLLEYPWVVRPVIFTSTDELISLVPSRIIAPAEEKHQARQRLLNELFPS